MRVGVLVSANRISVLKLEYGGALVRRAAHLLKHKIIIDE